VEERVAEVADWVCKAVQEWGKMQLPPARELTAREVLQALDLIIKAVARKAVPALKNIA